MRAVGWALTALGGLGFLGGLVLVVVFMFAAAARPGAQPNLVDLVGASFVMCLVGLVIGATGLVTVDVAS